MSARFTLPSWLPEHSKAYDVMAATPAALWFGYGASKMLPGIAHTLANADLSRVDIQFVVSLMAQVAAFLFLLLALGFLIVRAPAKRKAEGFMPRIMALGGTYFGVAIVLLPPQPMNVAISLISLGCILGGFLFSVFSLSHLGRSFSLMAEARRLVTDGPYAFIRHPLYLGEAISMFGLTLQYSSPLAFLFMALQFAFQFQRMKNEEEVLARQFAEYEGYRLRTARILPGIY